MEILIIIGVVYFLFIIVKNAKSDESRNNHYNNYQSNDSSTPPSFQQSDNNQKKKYPSPNYYPSIDKRTAWIVKPEDVFKKNYISFTRLKTFNQCPRKFELIYLCGNPDISGRAAELGSIVHKMAELITGEFLGERTESIYENNSPQKLLDYFDESINEVKPKHYFSSDEVYPYLVNFLNTCSTAKKQKIVDKEVEINTFISDYPVKCIIDRVDTIENNVKLIDYKTGKKQYVDKLQLQIYGTAYHQFNNKKSLTLEYQFLKDGSIRTWDFPEASIIKTKEIVLEKAHEIENTKAFYRKKSPLCNYCAVSSLCYLH